MKSILNAADAKRAFLFILEVLIPVVILIMGVVVLYGWITENKALIQIRPEFAPMKFNTALCFVMSGAALLFYFSRLRKWAHVPSWVPFLIGGITLLEYLFAVNVGIDEFFHRDFVLVKTSHPGRMSPNTALCFFLFGTAFLMAPVLQKLKIKQEIVVFIFCGAIVFSMGVTSLIGYQFRFNPTIGWGSFTMMAIHTSVGTVALGGTCLVIASRLLRENKRWKLLGWLAFFVFLGGVITSFSVALALSTNELQTTRKLVDQSIQNMGIKIQTLMDQQNRSFLRMAKRKAAWREMAEAHWLVDARGYFEDFQSLQAVEWISPKLRIEWIYPRKGNEAALGLDLGFEKNRREALESAGMSGKPTITPQIKLVQGMQGFLVYYPVGESVRDGGLIASVYDTKKYFDNIIAEFRKDFEIEISENGAVIYRSSEQNQGVHQYQGKTRFEPSGGSLVWELTARPKQPWVSRHVSKIKFVIPLIGIVVCLILSGALIFLNQWLTVKNALRDVEAVHRNLVANLPIGVIVLNLDDPDDAGSLRLDFANQGAEKALRISLKSSLGKKFVDVFPNVVGTEIPEAYRQSIIKREQKNLGEIVYGDYQVEKSFFSVNAIPFSQSKVAVLFENVTERVNANKKLLEMSLLDELTGLHNKRSFQNRLAHLVEVYRRSQQPFAVITVDLDGFKEVNDTLGHAMGDRVLKHVAVILREVVFDGDFIARTGGDEFVILAINIKSGDGIKSLLSRLVSAIQSPLPTDQGKVGVSCSVGAAIFPDDGGTVEKILEASDQLMYRAKQSGKNQIFLGTTSG